MCDKLISDEKNAINWTRRNEWRRNDIAPLFRPGYQLLQSRISFNRFTEHMCFIGEILRNKLDISIAGNSKAASWKKWRASSGARNPTSKSYKGVDENIKSKKTVITFTNVLVKQSHPKAIAKHVKSYFKAMNWCKRNRIKWEKSSVDCSKPVEYWNGDENYASYVNWSSKAYYTEEHDDSTHKWSKEQTSKCIILNFLLYCVKLS